MMNDVKNLWCAVCCVYLVRVFTEQSHRAEQRHRIPSTAVRRSRFSAAACVMLLLLLLLPLLLLLLQALVWSDLH